MISTTSLRPGNVFEFEKRKYLVLKHQHIKKGRGQAVNRIKIKDLESGSIVEKTFTNEQEVQEADVLKKSAQYLYMDDRYTYFMSTDDYSQFEILNEQIENELLYLIEGLKVIILYIDGKPISIEIPKTIEAEIEYTEPGVSGNTVSGAMKDAKIVTGLIVKVPLFIKTGDVIKINTDTNSYVSRI
jgi:elongation factor P